MKKHNLSLLCDFYEYTMANAYQKLGRGDDVLYFDVYFRKVPDEGGFAVAGGLASIIDYIKDLHFEDDDIAYLAGKGIFSNEYLEYLRTFHFTGDVYAMPEGTPIFPNEPVITIRAKATEAQIIETYALVCFNHQSLISTKANRIVRAAKGRAIMEFGARRAQGATAAYEGARSAYIAGCAGTSNALTDKLYGVPATGTMAHSWIQVFDTELESFLAYCETYPTSASLLVDTYNVLKSGVPNAIKAFDTVLRPKGITECSIRIDSGDITYLSQKARKMLDDAGWPTCKIVASNSLDENIIREIIMNDGKVDSFGVGERLITAKSDAVFGGVYKLVAVEKDGEVIPKIKISENVAKITTPHFKQVYRLFENQTKKAIADLVCVYDEVIDEHKPLTIFDPDYTWKNKTITDFTARPLLVPIFKNGELVYKVPSVERTREYCLGEIECLWDEVKRFENPHDYYVDLSQKLWDVKNDLLNRYKGTIE